MSDLKTWPEPTAVEIKPQYHAVYTQKDYYDLVATGMAWELFPQLELTWEEYSAAQTAYFNLESGVTSA